MSSREPSWAETLDTIVSSRLRSVHTALPGTIRSYDAGAVTAQVELAVQLEGTSGAYERVPPLADVPVVTPGAWSAGDKCLVVFCEEDSSKWWDTDGVSVEPPAVQQRHGLHAVCIPIVATAGEAVDFVALKGLVEAALLDLLSNVITAAGSITAPGGGPAFVAALTAYQTLITTPGPTALQVGAEKLKAR
jgi:hypothetical protein